MNKKDIIFSIICGLLVAWIMLDLFGVNGLIFFIIFPILSVAGLFVTDKIGQKYPFIRQSGRFFLVGSFADVVDIKIFQILFLIFPFSLPLKAISFLGATFIKYWQNKYWAFENAEKEGMKKEAVQFFAVTLIGLVINVISFYYFGKIKTGLPNHIWQELCIILSALVAAIWNFLGYKFIVFKK